MSGSDHAILDLGEDELQFTKTDYKAQVRWLQPRNINTACSRALELPWRSSLPWCLQTRQPRAGTLPGWWRRRAGRPPHPTSGHSTSISSSLILTRWMWGTGKLQVFPSKGSPVFIILLLTGWCTVCCQCLVNHFYSTTSDPGWFIVMQIERGTRDGSRYQIGWISSFNRPDLYGPFWVCVTLVFRYREI